MLMWHFQARMQCMDGSRWCGYSQKWQMVVSAIYMTIFVAALAASTQEAKDIGLSAGMMGSVRPALSTIVTTIYIAILTNKRKINISIYMDSIAAQGGMSQSELSEV